jgi:signal transduction histidine kinase
VAAAVTRTLADGWTYRRLGYLLSALPLGQAWFIALVTGWSLCLGFAITPLVIPLLMGLSLLTRGMATVESELASSLLGVRVDRAVPAPSRPGFWARFKSMFRSDFWRAQAYLLIRWLTGLTLGVVFLALLTSAAGMIFAPLWVPFVHGGAHLGIWRPHTVWQSLALVPIGLLLLPITLLAVNPLAKPFGSVAQSLLAGSGEPARSAPQAPAPHPASGPTRQGLRAHATVDALVFGLLTLIWAVTSGGYFWPIWVALPLGVALGIHYWSFAVSEHPPIVQRFRGDRALAIHAGVSVVLGLFFVVIWAITSQGYFWPIWPILALATVFGAHAAAVLLSSPGRAELTERIETLETTRAGAVDVQASELRRIERDLHDGAQARLVALGMSLGMAEQKLADDPKMAGELLAEARVGAEQALRELRNLARGIHPPVLTDRGLEAAIRALANSTPIDVALAVDLPSRPPVAVESAAYFVVAEALANAAKHARADRVDIRIAQAGPLLIVDVVDDGAGGADPAGSGLTGLRRRVQALDGTLQVTSPPGGPTTVHAEMPCAW